jgi:hypothetical protein
VIVTLSVQGPLPDRAEPGRCADRGSPHAAPLAAAAAAAVAQDPAAFPLREPFGITIRSGTALPRFDGYDVDDTVIEVLVDVGMIADERQQRWARCIHDRTLGTTYVVAIEPE